MKNWFHIFPKSTGLSPYVWIIFCILPFYFIFKSTSSKLEMVIRNCHDLLFFVAYGLSFASRGWRMYLWSAIQILISIAMTNFFGLYLFFFISSFFYWKYQK